MSPRVDGRAEVDRGAPGARVSGPRGAIDVESAECPRPVGHEHHLPPVTADVGHLVVGRRVDAWDLTARPERAVGPHGADVDVLVQPIEAGAGVEQVRSGVGLDDRRAELAAGEVRTAAVGLAAQVGRHQPALDPMVPGSIDVACAARPGATAGAHEVQALAGQRRGAEVGRCRVHRRGQVDGRAPRGVDARSTERPDVVRIGGATDRAGARRGDEQLEAVRGFDRAAIGDGTVDADLEDGGLPRPERLGAGGGRGDQEDRHECRRDPDETGACRSTALARGCSSPWETVHRSLSICCGGAHAPRHPGERVVRRSADHIGTVLRRPTLIPSFPGPPQQV